MRANSAWLKNKMELKKGNNTPNYREYATVSDAALILGISIDTVRRWENAGKLQAVRLDGKNRYFLVEQLHQYKSMQPLSTSEVAKLLDVSQSTVRRLEDQGLLKPLRNDNGKRLYDREAVDTYLRRNEQEPHLASVRNVPAQEAPQLAFTHAQAIQSPIPLTATKEKDEIAEEVTPKQSIAKRVHRSTYRTVQRAIVYTVTIGMLLISLFTFILLISPTTMTKFFWKGGNNTGQQSRGVVERVLQPFADRALNVTSVIDPSIRDKVQPVATTDVTGLFTKDDNGTITTSAGFSPPNSSYLKIPDSNLVINLNSEYVQGQKPGNSEGDIALLPITSSYIKDGTIVADDIAAGGINLANLSQEVLAYIGTNQQQPVVQPAPFTGITGIQAGPGLTGGGTSGTPTISLQTGLSTQIISGGVEVRLGTSVTATTTSVSGLEVSSSGLQLIAGCSANQILKWNGTEWTCASDIAGGGSFDVQEGGSTVTSPVAAINFNAGEFNVTDNVGQATIGLDYANSGITRRNQNETIAGTWSFANATFSALTASTLSGSGSGITGLNASNISSGTVSDARLSSNVTTQGNTFNGNSQLVQTTAGGLLPALNGSLITNVNAATLAGQNAAYYLDLGNATGTLAIARIADGSLTNAKLQNSSVTVNPGTGLSGGGVAALGGSTTLNLANTTVVAASYGSASSVSSFTVDAQGRLTGASNVPIAINSSNIANDSVVLGTQTTGSYIASLGTLTGLSTTGNSGEGSNPTLSILYGSSANTSVQGNTAITCASGSGNLTGGGNSITLGAGGSCNAITTNSAVTFSTSVTTPSVTNAGALSIIATGAGNNLTLGAGGSIILNGYDCTGLNGGVLTVHGGVLTCDDDDGGAGGSMSGSGTANKIALFTGTTTLASSWLTQNGSDLEIDATRNVSLLGGNLNVTGEGTFTEAVTAGSFTGDGSALSNVNASLLNGQNAAYYLNAANLTGTLNDARLSTNVTTQGNTFNGNSQLVQTTAGGLLPALNGSLVTNVNAVTLGGQNGAYYLDLGNATGTLADARLSSNVTLAGNSFNGVSQLVQLDGSGALPALNGSAVTGVNAAQLGGQAGSYYLDLGNATGTLNIARIADASITNAKLANSSIATSFGANLSGSASVALGGTLTVSMSATPNFTSVSAITFTGALSGNASTATALAANPTDCAADTYATAIAANGNLSCASITDASLSANVTKLGATITKDELTNSGVLGFTWGDSEVSDTLTIGASSTVADGALSVNVTTQGNTFNGNSQLVQTTAGGLLPALNGSLVTNVNASQLGGQAGSYFLDLGNATGTLGIARIADSSITNAKLANNSVTVSAGTGLSGGGNVVLGASTSLSVAYGAVAGTAVQGNTTLTCVSGTGNLSGGGNSITLGSGGTCNSITTNNAVSFGTSVTTPTVTNAGNLTLLSSGAGSDIVITTADKLLLTGFNCSAFDNGGVLTVNANGEVVCDNDDGGAAGTITGSGSAGRIPLYSGSQSLGTSWLAQTGSVLQLDNGRDLTLLGGTVTATTFAGALTGNATTASALVANPTDCAANQFANAIAANGNLTCVALTDADVPDTLTIGSSSTVADGALSANVTKLGATITKDEITNSGVLGFAWSNSEVTDALTVSASGSVADGALTANVTLAGNTFNGSNQLVQLDNSGLLPVLNGSALTNVNAVTLGGQAGAYYLDLVNATGTLNISRLADASVTNAKLVNSSINTSFGTNLSGSASVALGGTLTVNMSATPSFTSVSATTFTGALSGNATTASALAANPTDCAADTYATAIAANGNLTCAGVTDASLSSNVTKLGTTITKDELTNSGILGFTWGDSEVNDALTISASGTVADGALSANVTKLGNTIDLATSEVSGSLRATNFQSAGADLGAANVTVDLSNTNGAFVTNFTVDGTITATNIVGALTGNASTATALSANPTDCSTNQFATAIAANGNLTCAALTDNDIPNSITVDLATAASALAANPTDCSANQFANAIAANGNLTCAALTDADIPDTLTVGASSTVADGALSVNVTKLGSAIDLATSEVSGNLRATNLQNTGADLGAANVTVDLSNTNGSFVTNLTVDGGITAATFSGNLTGNVTGALTGNASTATALAANPTDCAANQFANAIAANGNLTCAALTDSDVPDTLTIGASSTVADGALSTNITKLGSTITKDELTNSGVLGFTWSDSEVSDTLTIGASSTVADGALSVNVTKLGSAIDLATSEVSGNLRASNLQSAAADLGAADVTINLGNTNGSFNTNLTLDGTITASSFSGALAGNASTATALAANPADCAANQFANAIAANGNLSCVALTDADIPDSITINLAATATALAANPTDCSTNQFATSIAASGNLTCAAVTDADVPNSITIDLATAATALAANPSDCAANQFATTIAANGNLTCVAIAANNLPTAAADLGAADVNLNFSNINGSFVTNFTIDGTITAGTLVGALTGNATTATALAANPTDCAANQFANAIAANGNLSCAAITDADVSDTLTASSFVGSGSTTTAIDLATAEVAGVLTTSKGGTGLGSYTLNGVFFASSTSVMAQVTGTGGQMLLANGSGVPTFTTITGDVGVSSSGVTTIQANSVALGADTTGNYVGNITVGNGLEVSGLGSENATASLGLDVATTGVTTTTTSNSGLELTATGLKLLGGCTNGQILKSNGTDWACGADATGFSDSQLKQNITNVASVLDDIKNVRVVNYDFKCLDPGLLSLRFDCSSHVGIIAQELQSIFPNAIQTDPATGYLQVNFRALNFYTLRAVVELASKIDGTGNASLNSVSTGGTVRLTSTGVLQNITGLTVASGGASINGGLNNNSGGITNAGSITGVGASITGTGAVTLASGGSGSLTLDSASNVVVLADATIRRTATGTTNIDLSDTLGTTLVVTNSGLGAADLNIAEGGLQTNGTTRITNAGALQNITGITVASGGINNTGGFDNNNGGITEAGAISGITSLGSSGNVTFDLANLVSNSTLTITNSSVSGVASLSVEGGATFGAQLVVSAGGASISGGLNNNSGGITNAGSIAGATTIAASGNINTTAAIQTGGTTRISNTGALQNITTITASGNINTTGVYQKGGVNGATASCTGSNYPQNLSVSGGIVISAFTCAGVGLSDERVKTNITDLGDDILGKLKDVRPVSFDFDCTNPAFADNNLSCDAGHQSGVIAQEIAQVFPELVYQDENGLYRVKYDQLNTYNLKATIEIAKYIDEHASNKLDLDLRMDGLDSRIATLEQDVADLQDGLTQGSGEQINLEDLMVGKLTVSLDLLVSGGLVVNGPAEFKGTTLFDQLVTFGDSIAVNGDMSVLGTATFNNSAGGYATINPGQQTVHITFSRPYAAAPIINVSLGQGKFAQYSYNNVTATGFDIVINEPATEQLQFSWTATSISNALTFAQP